MATKSKSKYRPEQIASEDGLEQIGQYQFLLAERTLTKYFGPVGGAGILFSSLAIWWNVSDSQKLGFFIGVLIFAMILTAMSVFDYTNPSSGQTTRFNWRRAQDLVALFETPAGQNALRIYNAAERLLKMRPSTSNEWRDRRTEAEDAVVERAEQAITESWHLAYEQAGMTYDERAAIALAIESAQDRAKRWHQDLEAIGALTPEEKERALSELEQSPHSHNQAA